MLNKIVYKKCTKIPKNEKNERCAYTNIFKRIEDVILIIFVGSNTPFGLPLTRISWHKDPYSKKAPPFQATVALLAIFDPFLTYRGLNINIQSTPVMLTKISGDVFDALKMPQSKYHPIWTSKFRSQKNQFQMSLFRGAPFQINTFILFFCKL